MKHLSHRRDFLRASLLTGIKVIGEPIAKHVRRYKLADNIDQQLVWMTRAK